MRFLVSVLLAALWLPLSAQSQVLGEIPFQFQDGLIWLKVGVAGKSEPLNFLLDSGAGVSAMDLQTACFLRLKLVEQQTVQRENATALAKLLHDFPPAFTSIYLPTSVF